jgi:MtfA peptidase
MGMEYLQYLANKAKFYAWILVLFVLLLFIPVLLKAGNGAGAKWTGLIFVCTACVYLWRLRTRSVRRILKAARIRMTKNEQFWLNKKIAFYRELTASDKIVFEDRIGLFLAEIKIKEIGKPMPDKEVCLLVASSAIIAYWGLPYWNYGELSEVLVYPNNYTEDKQLDARGTIQGSVFHGGLMNSTMILSLPALRAGFANSKDGRNVGIHEFAHQLDKDDGAMDGSLVGFSPKQDNGWYELVNVEMKKMVEGKSDLDAYGATNEIEFFAVLMENYREKPEMLKKKHPFLFAHLQGIFARE